MSDLGGRLEHAFDALAMVAWPWVARAFGYEFCTGTDLAEDGKRVLDAVWGALGVTPPASALAAGRRYDIATTWIVAYRGGSPVGVFGLLDMRIASLALDYDGRLPPEGLDLKTTRELGRLAILPAERGRRGVVMVGLLREMLLFAKQHEIRTLFAGSTRALFEVYRRYNPTARIVATDAAPPEDPTQASYFAAIRARCGPGVHYTFDVEGARPWIVFTRFLSGRLKRPVGVG